MYEQIDLNGCGQGPAELILQVVYRKKDLVNQNVGILCILEHPSVRSRIAGKHELQPLPFQDKADRTVNCVDRRNGPNNDAVLIVDFSVDRRVIELSDLDFQRRRR